MYLRILVKRNERRKNELETSKEKLTELLSSWNEKQSLLEKQTSAFFQMEQYLEGQFNQEAFLELFDLLVDSEEEVEIVENLEQEIQVEKKFASERAGEAQEAIKSKNDDPDKTSKVVRKLKYAAGELHSIPGFKKITEDLLQRAERMENRGFTVALFGAFSAGKSSFANALIGEKLLPVSPNPTTAAINKIMPVDNEHEHGLVKVQLKEQNALFKEVCRSLSVFDMKARDFADAKIWIEKVLSQGTNFDAHEKTHFAFLKAFHRGFEVYRARLGEIIITDLEELKEFVANEEKSCLVESIEVYFDCELTQKGITLVDTPGADSINARHTGVAFEYIKNSDAILFVTYYNHAFSKADREFLIQLGRVKDTFELDKMFFIVNAVDLANNEDEKMDVLNYVDQQLIKYGIRRPNLFPISSLRALKEKLEKTRSDVSGIQNFEEKFYSFITHDLTDITINSGLKEWQRVVELLQSYILSAQQDNSAKKQKMTNLQQEQKSIEEFLQGQSTEFQKQRLNQEIDELIYYIKQRVFFRFNGFFKEAFNPSVLRDDGRNLKKVLTMVLDDFLNDFGFDFAQELRATTLRIEAFIGKLLSDFQQRIKEDLSKINQELSYSQHQSSAMEAPDFDIAFIDIERDLFKKALSYFKNPKSFFEHDEKRFMKEELENILQQPADEYLEKENKRLKLFYVGHLKKETEALISLLCEETEEYYEGMYAALRNEIPVEQLIQLKNKVCDF